MKLGKYVIAIVLIGALSLLAKSIVVYLDGKHNQTIFINEICSWNETIIKDSNHKYSDYIELYNISDEKVSLSGWYLSDDKKQLKKVELSDIWIDSKGFFVFYANGDNEDSNSLPFKINSEGEGIFLSDPEGNLVDSIFIPSIEADTAYARCVDGTGEWIRMEPSPENTNIGCEWLRNPILEEPIFSAKGGFYMEPFFLEINANPGESIYYTLDGSEPTEESDVYVDAIYIDDVSDCPNIYNSIQNVVLDWKNFVPCMEVVDKAVIVRAVAMDNAYNVSETVTETYFVRSEKYKDADVLSIVADKKELFGENGIYVTGKEYDDWYLSDKVGEAPLPNFQKSGRRMEIKGNMELFEAADSVLNQRIGLRIQGAYSRSTPKKRFSIYARREYSQNVYFDYNIFENKLTHSIVLRDGFANAVMPELVDDRSIGTQSARPIIVFLNGEYWYTTYIQEKFNKYYLSEKYKVDKDNVSILQDWEVGAGDVNIEYEYVDLLEYFAQNDFLTEESYDMACEKIDVQSFIDFMCVSSYLCNMDMSEGHNHLLWKSNEKKDSKYEDGRWRWLLYDLDYVDGVDLEFYGINNHAELNAFSTPMQNSTQHKAMDEMTIFAALRYNEKFKKQFVLSFMDIANTNFSLKNVEKILGKWGSDLHWHDDFFLKRFEYAVEDLAEEFSLQGSLEDLALEINNTDGGTIKVNTCIPDLSNGSWTGKYYTDYPVSITATPNEGYRFIGWEGDNLSSEETISVQLIEGGTTIKAIFEKIEKK